MQLYTELHYLLSFLSISFSSFSERNVRFLPLQGKSKT